MNSKLIRIILISAALLTLLFSLAFNPRTPIRPAMVHIIDKEFEIADITADLSGPDKHKIAVSTAINYSKGDEEILMRDKENIRGEIKKILEKLDS